MLTKGELIQPFDSILSNLAKDRMTLITDYCSIKDQISNSKKEMNELSEEYEQRRVKAHTIYSMLASFIILGAIFVNLAGLVFMIVSTLSLVLYKKYFDKTYKKDYEVSTEKFRASIERLEEKKTKHKYDIEKMDVIIKNIKEIIESLEERDSGFISNHPLSNLPEDTEAKKLTHERTRF